jgi:hypothetical protein
LVERCHEPVRKLPLAGFPLRLIGLPGGSHLLRRLQEVDRGIGANDVSGAPTPCRRPGSLSSSDAGARRADAGRRVGARGLLIRSSRRPSRASCHYQCAPDRAAEPAELALSRSRRDPVKALRPVPANSVG